MRTTRERIVHAVLLETLAIAIVTPTITLITKAPLADAGLLSVLISLGAVASNYLWTMLFDRLVPTRRRGFWVRATQAIGLEAIISSFSIPLVILLTGVTFWNAVLLDLSGIAFFVVFTMAYNAAFDAIMIRILASAG